MEENHGKKLILDLRDNPGGYVRVAQEFLGFFEGVSVAYIQKDKWSQKEVQVIKQNQKIKTEVVVLINENTASASEIVTAALRHYSRAKIIGTDSYGKGLMQNTYILKSRDILKVSVAEFLTLSNEKINSVGIKPDIYSNSPKETAYYYLVIKDKLIMYLIYLLFLILWLYELKIYYKSKLTSSLNNT